MAQVLLVPWISCYRMDLCGRSSAHTSTASLAGRFGRGERSLSRRSTGRSRDVSRMVFGVALFFSARRLRNEVLRLSSA